ncbi:unnamed protein product [Blepharisma stoltei]|uniref:Uncharacterized protein n=1 Tax=Blepharisma stoltei TaxID=1481888 RepID=A0AAU9IJ66_9CILI|nr:unnamed protein product [Blepharisma stoltei]
MNDSLESKRYQAIASFDSCQECTPTLQEDSRFSLVNYGQISRSASFRIEDKLLQKQIGAQKRLDDLRKKREQELLQELQEKPKISNKSKELAKKADLRYHELLADFLKEKDTKHESIENFEAKDQKPQRKAANISKAISRAKSSVEFKDKIKSEILRKSVVTAEKEQKINVRLKPKEEFIVKFDIKDQENEKKLLNTEATVGHESPELSPIKYEMKRGKDKKRRKSLLDLSAAERSKLWEDQKRKKIEAKVKAKEENSMVECTFKPIIHQAPKPAKSLCYAKENIKYSQSSKPQSSDSSFLSFEIFPHKRGFSDLKYDPNQFFSRNNISSSQINVSFKSGCNLDELISRSKNL